MSIDWITVAAQIANFLVLVWLLRRFLYRPILDGIDAREAEIKNRMQEAVLAKEKAQAAEQEHLDQVRALNAKQSDMAEAVRQDAETQRDALLDEARKRLEKERVAWAVHLEEERHKYAAKLQCAGGGALLSLTRKALSDLADETLEGRIAHNLAKRIEPMAEDLRVAAGQSKTATVTSQGKFSQSARDDLTAHLQSVFPDIPVQFETDADQPPGVMLRIGGAQLDWTVDGYIDGLSDLLDAQLAAGVDLKMAST
ncbi:F0F1 ATP synthase subunit B (plasmid) [Sulfitobacter sp. SK012]|uniref:F0F1 ATP synthase subunit B family protein n=1 Tax=Sulfitobacter sp. SK012 TaxID=1389005 RepID=UPI000E0C17B9|nr:F0F1 ATP synthase subunit B [Sulfitobacter sp. SK012]AXI49158.1 F0F1 ATP synthase subunit B [Sulfitobacter sp. SK012]